MIKGNCAHIVYEFIFPLWITHTSGNIINAIHFLRVSKQKRNIFDIKVKTSEWDIARQEEEKKGRRL